MKEMIAFFPRLINVSAVAGIVILFVLAARLCLKRAPKIFSYALWAVVLVRLLILISITSPVSAIPEIQTTNSAEINAALPDFDFELPSDRLENKRNLQNAIETGNPITVRVGHSLEPTQYLAMGWMIGMGIMLVYSVVSYLKLRRKLQVVVPLRDNVFIADDIKSPFVIGFIRPKIYLPCNLGDREQEYIILHEQHHIRRLDHIIKALAFLALTIHWFNPLVWVAFVLASKDMEMSCDEAVIRKIGEDVRADYSASLLTLATGRRIIAGTPLAFGEGNTKGRIRNLANWRRPAFWVILIAIIICIVLGMCLLTNPVTYDGDGAGVTYYQGTVVVQAVDTVGEDNQIRHYITIQDAQGKNHTFWMPEDYDKTEDLLGEYVIIRTRVESDAGLTVAANVSIADAPMPETLDEAINQAILDYNWSSRYEGMCSCASFVQLSSESNGVAAPDSPGKLVESATVYGLAFYQVFRLEEGILVEEGGSHVPVVLTFTYDASEGFTLTEYWQPRDGSYYAKDINAKFNGRPYPDTQKYIMEQKLDTYAQAMEFYAVGPDVVVNTIIEDICSRQRWHDDFESLMEDCTQQRAMLVAYGSHTLKYCYSEFMEGGCTDLRGDVMAYACQEIMESVGESLIIENTVNNGQQWFDAFASNAMALKNQYSSDELERMYPVSWIYLSMVCE